MGTLPEATKTGIVALAQDYGTSFRNLATVWLALPQETAELSKAFAEITPKVDALISGLESRAAMADTESAAIDEHVRTVLIIAVGASVCLTLFACVLIGLAITRPLGVLTGAMQKLASGAVDTEVPDRDRRNEIGLMASALQVFKDNMIETERLKVGQEEIKERTEAERRPPCTSSPTSSKHRSRRWWARSRLRRPSCRRQRTRCRRWRRRGTGRRLP